MAEVTTEEMIALLNADIKFAKMIGDKEFVGYLKETKDKLLKEMGEAVAKEYVELFGKKCLTISPVYEIIKTMKRDFWSGNHPLGHVTLLVSLRILK